MGEAGSPAPRGAQLLAIIVKNSVHRVYICDENTLPLGVVTLTDIMQLFAVDPDQDDEGWLDLTMS